MILRKRLDARKFFKLEGFGTTPDPTGWIILGSCHACKSSSVRGNPETGRIRCPACGLSLDPIAFVKMKHRLSTVDAAKRIGIWVDSPAH